MSNTCTRCGTERIPSKSWEGTVQIYGGTSIVLHEEFVCPDPECQKVVEAQLLAQKAKRKAFERQKELEKQARLKHKAQA